MAYDLHVHSGCSRHVRITAPSPEQVAIFAKEAGLDGFALSDHDTRAGIRRAQTTADRIGIDFIPGIEMSFSYKQGENFYVEGEILGYFIDPDFPILKQIEKGSEDSRKIRDSGLRKALDIPKGELQRFAGDPQYTRDTIADFVVQDGRAKNRSEAYDNLLKPAGKGLVEREKTPLKDVITIITKAGGIPICAHLGMIIRDYSLWPGSAFETPVLKESLPENYDPMRDFEEVLLPVFLKFGIRGFEIYPYNLVGKGVSMTEHSFFNDYAKALNYKNGLIDGLRGSDAHFQPQILTEIGCFTTTREAIDQLKEEHLRLLKRL